MTKLSEDVLYTNVFISTHLIYPHEHDEEKRKPPPTPTNKQTNQPKTRSHLAHCNGFFLRIHLYKVNYNIYSIDSMH